MKFITAALVVALFAAPAAFADPSVVGSMQGWDPADPDYILELQANGVWELEKLLEAGSYDYKVTETDLWDGNDFPSNNQTVSVDGFDFLVWYVNLGATVGTKEGDEYVFHSENPPIVCGDFMDELGGTDWDQTDETLTDMNDDGLEGDGVAGDGIYSWESVIPAGSYNFKVVLNNNWDQDTYPPAQNYVFGSNGTDAVLFRYHMYDNTTEVFTEAPGSVLYARAETGDGPVRVKFSKNMDPVTSQVPGNYSLVGDVSGAQAIVSAIQDPDDHSIVRLILGARAILPAGDDFTLTVTGVEDASGNPIDPLNNTGCFYTNEVTFEINMHVYIEENGLPATLHIQGDTEPLTWGQCEGSEAFDNGVAPDVAAADSTYTLQEFFAIPYDCDDTPAGVQVKYKYIVDCTTWEGDFDFGHFVDLSPDSSSFGVNVWWNDMAPQDFTTCDVNVLFRVSNAAAGCDTIALAGSELPLDWDPPYDFLLNDDGLMGDETPGDGIFSRLVTFPSGTFRSLNYKYVCNNALECDGLPDRTLELDDVNACAPNQMEVLDLYDWCSPVTGIELQPISWGKLKSMYQAK
jgi:hypothetical protein